MKTTSRDVLIAMAAVRKCLNQRLTACEIFKYILNTSECYNSCGGRCDSLECIEIVTTVINKQREENNY
jgi:hypothetical protein